MIARRTASNGRSETTMGKLKKIEKRILEIFKYIADKHNEAFEIFYVSPVF